VVSKQYINDLKVREIKKFEKSWFKWPSKMESSPRPTVRIKTRYLEFAQPCAWHETIDKESFMHGTLPFGLLPIQHCRNSYAAYATE